MAMKFKQSGYSNRLANEIQFGKMCAKYTGMQNINILSRHHKRMIDWKAEYRNKYSCDRWINDGRGCGYGCIVAKKRFYY